MTGSQDDGPVTPGRRPFDRTTIPGHARPRLWTSVRVRLLIPVLLATVAVAVLGAFQVSSALDEADRADHSTVLAQVSGAVGTLVHEVAAEYLEHNLAVRQ